MRSWMTRPAIGESNPSDSGVPAATRSLPPWLASLHSLGGTTSSTAVWNTTDSLPAVRGEAISVPAGTTAPPPGWSTMNRTGDAGALRRARLDADEREQPEMQALGDPVDAVDEQLGQPRVQLDERDARVRDVVLGPLRCVPDDARARL